LDGPKFVRNDVFSLNSLEIADKNTGWREPSSERVDELTATFSEGGCGISVICDIRVLDTKSVAGHRLVDDGVSTIRALVRCWHCFQAFPNSSRGKPWSPYLVHIFTNGLPCMVVKYSDDNDRALREAWNIARHDSQANTCRPSSFFQKFRTVKERYFWCGNWDVTTQILERFYGSGSRKMVGRWVRAVQATDETVCGTLKRFPELKEEYICMYLANSSSMITMTHQHDHLSQAFNDRVYKPLNLIQTWHRNLIRQYGYKACRSLALDGVIGDLCTTDGLLKVLAISKAGGLLEGGPDNQGIPECFRMVRDLEESEAKACSLAPPIKNPTASVRLPSLEREKQQREATPQAEKGGHGGAALVQASAVLASTGAASTASTLADEADLCQPSSSSPIEACLGTVAKVMIHTKTQSRPAVANNTNAGFHRKRKSEGCDDTIPTLVESARKTQKVDDIVLGTLAYTPCDVVLRRDQVSSRVLLLLKNKTTKKIKIPRDTMLLSFCSDTSLSQDSKCNLVYEMTMKSDMWCKSTSRRMRFGTCVQNQKTRTREIFGYMAFPAGDIPKVLVKKDDRTLKFVSTAPNHPDIYAAIKAAKNSRTCSPIWMMKCAHDNSIQPYGLTVVSNKPLSVPDCGELVIGQQG
jgi:hypothetical protein